ncbi:MAG: TIM barrel protein [Chloroflexi bacterium]|nr:TIM barrel protein [Chloroflexota bacterium]
MPFHLATAPDSWGVWFGNDPRQPPWRRYLDEVAEAGHIWTELGPPGYLPGAPDSLSRELAGRGLRACGAALMVHLEDPDAAAENERLADQMGALLAGLGARHFVLIDDCYSDLFTGTLNRPRELADDGWHRLVDAVHRIARLVRARHGLLTAFHPHAETHVETDAQIARFLVETDPALVSLCFDTGHHAYCGGDPLDFIRQHHARVNYLHVKNIDPTIHAHVRRDGTLFGPAVGMGVFAEPALGAIDMVALRHTLVASGYDGFVVVEQDMYPARFDAPLPIARRTLAYLREIGFG